MRLVFWAAVVLGLVAVFIVTYHTAVDDSVVRDSGDDGNTSGVPGLGISGIELGVYEVCVDVASCDVGAGLDRIRDAGGNAVIVTVSDENYAYYDSSYLPAADWVPRGYLAEVVDGAHERGMKVYALVFMPHGYWLSLHPEMISVLSDGRDSDYYSSDYFQRIVPPSRVVSDDGYLSLIEGVFSEVRSMGFDGIDINDNFQWAEWYVDDSDRTLYSSYDLFTVSLFVNETGVFVPLGSADSMADYIEGDEVVFDEWCGWRASKVTELLSLLDSFAGDLTFRPHLIFNRWVYEDFGLDYQGISDVVDVMYYMMTDPGAGYPSGNFAGSVYLYDGFSEVRDDIYGLAEAGAVGVYVFDYRLIDEVDYWDEVFGVFSSIREREA